MCAGPDQGSIGSPLRRTTMQSGSEKENAERNLAGANEIPTAPETLHKKPMQRKVPPHMRRLNMRYHILIAVVFTGSSICRFSSPSDNLSPMSQKLMLADRTNAAMKTYKLGCELLFTLCIALDQNL